MQISTLLMETLGLPQDIFDLTCYLYKRTETFQSVLGSSSDQLINRSDNQAKDTVLI